MLQPPPSRPRSRRRVTAPASSPASPQADVVAPAISLGGKTTQKLGQSIRLVVKATSENLWASLSGTLSVPGKAKAYKLIGVKNRFIAYGSNVTRKLKVPRKARAAIRLALRRHWRVEANVTLRVRDGAGNVAVKRRAIELKL